MSDDPPENGRRARRAVSDDALDPDVIDDTAGEAPAPERRGGRFAAPQEDPADDVTDDLADDPEDDPADDPADDPEDDPAPVVAVPPPGATPGTGPALPAPSHAAFMRPGTASPTVPSSQASGTPPEPVRPGGRFSSGPGSDEDGPAPRRSAATSTTPPEAPSFEAPGFETPGFETPSAAAAAGTGPAQDPPQATAAAATDPTDSSGDGEPPADELTTTAARNPWPTRILVGILVLALVAAAAYFTIQQSRKPGVEVTVTQSPSGEATPTGPGAISDASLLVESEAAAALGGAGWAITETLSEVLPSSAQVTCMTNPEGLPNAQATRQRVLTSTEPSALGALHRLDSYASAEVAAQAYQVRLAKLSACDDVPALLNSAADVEGLADESFSVTIAYQDPTVQYRTVVISRTGSAVSMLDVAQNDEAMDPAKVAAAVVEPSKRLCDSAAGTCPGDLTVRAQVVPPTPIYGWLAQSDIPRITAGQGLWSATQVGQVTTKGSQCENITLASVDGPTAREQRSYLLSQDDRAPEAFGVDQVRFVFPDAAAAKAFADKLDTDIAACTDRTETAEVSEDRTLSITGQNRQVVTGRVFLVTQATGADSKVYYRVAVVVSGERVTYLVSNTRENFDFTTDSWLLLAARSGQRITQSR